MQSGEWLQTGSGSGSCWKPGICGLSLIHIYRIHQVEGKVQAYISLNEEEALRQADECDKKRQKGRCV